MSELVNAPVRMVYRAAHLALRAYWLVRRPETHGALVALWFRGKILLIRSSYRATYSLPGGYVKSGEDARRAARRELDEELGLALPDDALRHAWAGSFPFEHRTDSLDIFEADLEEPFHVEPNGRELIWAGWKTPEEALAMEIVPHLRDYLDRRTKR
ncbi:NUDIX hydrolase [Sandaracinus amylolyticus]|uniref:NUDIX hydrolase n=1 Tax=Sandaracinus amylolyticus TaxID=927083 RepID=UPI00069EEE3E|nr:NUDIX hydrolase [Sandaracinus amylolyticus]